MHTTINSTSRSGILASLTLALAAASGATAGVYTTTYTLTTPYTLTKPFATQVVVDWSTDSTSGVINETNLTNWTIRLVDGATDIYTDTVITGGSVQSIGGVSRTISGVMFNFNLDTLTVGEFDNMLTGSALSGATGTAFNIYSYFNGNPPPYSPLGMWFNGIEGTRQLPGFSSVVTTPAPGVLAIAGLAGLAAARRRRG